MKAGDSLEIREGNYLEEIHISNLYGTPSFPIVIRPYSNEQVTMDGTVEINTDWTVTDTEHLYKTILEEDIWQLFKNDMIQTAGRFPNASWEDDSIFKLKQSTRQIKPYDSSFGYTVDARPSNAGNSEGIRVGKGSKIINNHVYNMSLIQHDGSLINVGAKDDMQKNTVISGNWSHDSYKASVRFDSANMGNPDTVLYGQYGTIADNIVWNAGPIKVKGNNHTVTGNVGFAPKSA